MFGGTLDLKNFNFHGSHLILLIAAFVYKLYGLVRKFLTITLRFLQTTSRVVQRVLRWDAIYESADWPAFAVYQLYDWQRVNSKPIKNCLLVCVCVCVLTRVAQIITSW